MPFLELRPAGVAGHEKARQFIHFFKPSRVGFNSGFAQGAQKIPRLGGGPPFAAIISRIAGWYL